VTQEGVHDARLMSLGGGLVLAVALCASAVFLGWSGRSPLAMSFADAAAGAGHLDAAIERYDTIAAVNPSEAVRADALWRAGMMLDADRHDAAAARSRFRRLSVMEGSDLRGPAYAQVGRILVTEERRLSAGGDALWDAQRVAPGHPDARRWLAGAAQAYAEAGEASSSERAWTALARDYPGDRVTALLGRAALKLAADDTTSALHLYRLAQDSAPATSAVAAVAGLGVATCLERLGDLDEALAELDAADLPDGVRSARAGGMRARVDG